MSPQRLLTHTCLGWILGTALLSGQTVLHYRVNAGDVSTVAAGTVPGVGSSDGSVDFGTLGLSSDVPSMGVPAGAGDRSLDFTGSQVVNIPGTQQLSNAQVIAAGGFTYELWFKWAGGGVVNALIDYAGTEKFRLTGGSLNLNFDQGSGSEALVPTPTTDEWHYIAAVFTHDGIPESGGKIGGTLTWYFDGDEVTGTSTVTKDDFGDSLNRTIGVGGHPLGFSNDYVTARIYEPRVTLGALAANELLYDAGPPVASDDALAMHHGGKVLIDVLGNDSGAFDPASLVVVGNPAFGQAAVQADGRILYTHTSGTPPTDTFVYRIDDGSGALPDTASVAITFADEDRIETDYLVLPSEPPASTYQLVEAFPGMLFDSPHELATAPGDNQRLFITEGDGYIQLIPDVSAPAPTKSVFLDITDRVQNDNNELAMKGLAFHPDYAANGYFYVTYNLSGRVRLSRFSRSVGDPNVADPNSELILIDQVNNGGIHNIGSVEFGPNDGYLYVSFGDEGVGGNTQRIDLDLWSCIIRIDVDKKPGSLVPNPDSDIPRVGGGNSGEAYFAIPPDNPFVGATSFNQQPVNSAQVRTEMYIVGMRNPWQFWIDPATDEVWVGDVGGGSREEFTVYSAGGNGGWGWLEGSAPGPNSGGLINGAAQSDATLTDPLWDYGRGDGPMQGRCATGGRIYSGSSYPALNGKYICADFNNGNVWSITRLVGEAPLVERIVDTGDHLVAIGQDPSNGDLLFVDRGSLGTQTGTPDRIMRLAIGSSDDSALPPTLSGTNFFADLGDLAPNPGAVAYEPNLSFWSDYAIKSRWFLIKNTTDTVAFSPDGAWTYPEGMVWVKHFDLETRRGDPTSRRRLETRFLVKTATAAYGISYRWNEEGTDAVLVGEAGETFDLQIDHDNDVSTPDLTQTWEIPSRSGCLACHTPEAGHALSFNTRQLNRDGVLTDSSGNFLGLLSNSGYLTGLSGDPASLERHLRPDEATYSLEARVRSYLAVNCSYCHQNGGTGPGFWDGRAELTLAETGLVNGPVIDPPVNPADRLVVPGLPDRSIIHNRIGALNGYTRMPPLASSEVDEVGLQLVQDWIAQELQPQVTYTEWRIAKFGNDSSPEGDPDADPDFDQDNNEFEWLTGTNPLDGTDRWQPSFTVDATTVSLHFPGLGNRSILIEESGDLQNWFPWDVAGNDGIPLNPSLQHFFSAPRLNERGFFRFRITER